jgi:hypothetical protein
LLLQATTTGGQDTKGFHSQLMIHDGMVRYKYFVVAFFLLSRKNKENDPLFVRAEPNLPLLQMKRREKILRPPSK